MTVEDDIPPIEGTFHSAAIKLKYLFHVSLLIT